MWLTKGHFKVISTENRQLFYCFKTCGNPIYSLAYSKHPAATYVVCLFSLPIRNNSISTLKGCVVFDIILIKLYHPVKLYTANTCIPYS